MNISQSPSSFSSSVPDDLLLLCREEACSLSGQEDQEQEREEMISRYTRLQANCSSEPNCHGRFSELNETPDPTARRSSIAWIIKTSELFHFSPHTTYLAVNYMDRFLSRRALPVSTSLSSSLVAFLSLTCTVTSSNLEGGQPSSPRWHVSL